MLIAVPSQAPWSSQLLEMRTWTTRGCCVLVMLAAACARGERTTPTDDTSHARCPTGFTVNPSRAARLSRLLAQTPQGSSLLAAGQATTWCFGTIDESVVRADDALLLLRDQSPDVPLAARLAHLLSHIAAPIPSPNPRDCNHWLAEVRHKEARAHATENAVRRHFGLAEHPPTTLEVVMRQYAERCRGTPGNRPAAPTGSK
jgi:hypothetical protein